MLGEAPAFEAFVTALLRPLNNYRHVAGRLLSEPHAMPEGASSAGRAGAMPDPTQILADSERLIQAVDTFVAAPLVDEARARLVTLINEIIRPVLIPHSAHHQPGQAPPTSVAKRVVEAPQRPSQPGGEPMIEESIVRDSSIAPDDRSEHAASRPASSATAASPQPLAEAVHIHEDAATPADVPPGSGTATITPGDAQQLWWQNRLERLNRRMNTGFMFMGAVGLSLVALNLYGTFARPGLGALERADPEGTAMASVSAPSGLGESVTPAAPAPSLDLEAIEALARQLKASGDDIANLLDDWGAGPGQALESIEGRMSGVEMELARLRRDLDTLDARWPTDLDLLVAQASGGPPLRIGPEVSRDVDDQPMLAEMAPAAAEPHEDTALGAVDDAAEPAMTTLDPVAPSAESPTPFAAVVPARELILTAPVYGLQLGAMRREPGARALAEDTGLDPESLFILASGSWQFVIYGWFADELEARSALLNLSPEVRRQRPLIRFAEAGTQVTPLTSLTP